MTTGRQLIDLCRTVSWGEMREEEREAFDEWLRTGKGHDLFLLLRYAMRNPRRPSSITGLPRVDPTEDDEED